MSSQGLSCSASELLQCMTQSEWIFVPGISQLLCFPPSTRDFTTSLLSSPLTKLILYNNTAHRVCSQSIGIALCWWCGRHQVLSARSNEYEQPDYTDSDPALRRRVKNISTTAAEARRVRSKDVTNKQESQPEPPSGPDKSPVGRFSSIGKMQTLHIDHPGTVITRLSCWLASSTSSQCGCIRSHGDYASQRRGVASRSSTPLLVHSSYTHSPKCSKEETIEWQPTTATTKVEKLRNNYQERASNDHYNVDN